MALTQTQLKHARSRLERAMSEKKKHLRVSYTTPASGPLTNGEASEWAVAGNYRLKCPADSRWDKPFWDIRDIFELTSTTDASVDDEGLKEATAVLQKSYDALMDELILGDAPDILAQIKAFIGDE